jgi:SSS family solute:Na+ symporter
VLNVNNMHLSLLDIAVVILYVTFVLVLAQFVSHKGDGDSEDSRDTVSKSRTLPWWAIGTSLIAANISAEQIIGMSGSAYALGLAIASYEWSAALILLIVGKYFLPIFLKNQIYTMPEFLRRRYGRNIQLVMASFWLVLYVFVNMTAILWLGATAVHTVTGLTLQMSVILLGLVAGNYALYVGLKAAAFTDVVQVSMLLLGGLVVVFVAFEKVAAAGGTTGLIGGFDILMTRLPEHFHMILTPDNPYYKYVPGLSVLVGGMWVMHLSYWGFNQSIIQRALIAKSVREAQKGVVLAAFLKLLIPVLVVLPGIAAAVLLPHLSRPDEAYPTLMTLLPSGLLGLAFVTLVAAIVASMGSTLSSIAAIFSNDVLKTLNANASKRLQVISGRFAAIVALVIAVVASTPLLGHFDQAFQYIQEYIGFLTPGIVVIFLLGMFWKRATEAGALVAAVGSVVLSLFYWTFLPAIPFMNRIGYVFLICLGLAVMVSLLQKPKPQSSTIVVMGIDYSTSASFNIAGLAVILILVALYTIWW